MLTVSCRLGMLHALHSKSNSVSLLLLAFSSLLIERKLMYHEADTWLVVSDNTIRMYVQMVAVVQGFLKLVF